MVAPDKVTGPDGKNIFDANVKGFFTHIRWGEFLRTIGGIILLIIAVIQLHKIIVGVLALVGGLWLLSATHLRK